MAQPRFWPAVGLGLMTVLSAIHLCRLPWRRITRYDWREARKWLSVLEFAGWFMGYVLLVPVIGYLPVTLVFVPLLSWRMGYRGGRMLGLAALFALAVVVVFKSFLAVKIPGGAAYEYLPDGLRSLFILYF
ncbi:tripartite tricarboxylate transporter TctB family protein [Jhaorihella thermophila]